MAGISAVMLVAKLFHLVYFSVVLVLMFACVFICHYGE